MRVTTVNFIRKKKANGDTVIHAVWQMYGNSFRINYSFPPYADEAKLAVAYLTDRAEKAIIKEAETYGEEACMMVQIPMSLMKVIL